MNTPDTTSLPAVSFYSCRVMHARLRPKVHRFSYRIFSTLIDIDRLDGIAGMSPVFSVGSFNLLSFHPRDHGPRDGTALRPHIDMLLAKAGLPEPPVRVLLLCMPRVLGTVFNPLSVYYCLDTAHQLVAAIFEVRNTFGEHHSYVTLANPESAKPEDDTTRIEQDKLFYVSPFFDMAMRYKFRLSPPDHSLRLRIMMDAPEGPVFSAVMTGKLQPFSTRNLIVAASGIPPLAIRVLGAIVWEAARIWLKGIGVKRRPPAPPATSFGDHGAYSLAKNPRKKTLLNKRSP